MLAGIREGLHDLVLMRGAEDLDGHAQVVERVDEREPVLLGELAGMVVGLVVHVAGQHDLGAQRLRALHLDERRGRGQRGITLRAKRGSGLASRLVRFRLVSPR